MGIGSSGGWKYRYLGSKSSGVAGRQRRDGSPWPPVAEAPGPAVLYVSYGDLMPSPDAEG